MAKKTYKRKKAYQAHVTAMILSGQVNDPNTGQWVDRSKFFSSDQANGYAFCRNGAAHHKVV